MERDQKPLNKALKADVLKALCLLSAGSALAQSFSSGSDGSYGPLIVTNSVVLQLPPDGRFNCTTVNIQQGSSLSFLRNALNTPVYLLATGDVTIAGSINVSGQNGGVGTAGQGGPGGFDGGRPANGIGLANGDGLGPGAGKAPNPSNGNIGRGSYGSQPNDGLNGNDGNTYGNTLIVPLIGGSGGAGGQYGNSFVGGGGGGGAILIASDTLISLAASGAIYSHAGNSSPGGYGSGGAIRLVAPKVTGTGLLDAAGGQGAASANGRVRIDATDRFTLFPVTQASYTFGRYMHILPPIPARLDILQAAGTAIPEGTSAPVSVQLPIGSPTNQTVTVQARDFTGVVPISVVVTPDSGPATRYDAQIDMSTGNPVQTNMSVVIPNGTSCRIYAWSR